MHFRILKQLIIFICFFSVQNLIAHEILLKDGQKLEGSIISLDEHSITVRTSNGNINIKKDQILEIKYRKDEPVKTAKVVKNNPEHDYLALRLSLQSALLPGRGFRTGGDKKTGYVYGAAFLGLSLGTLYSRYRAVQLDERYRSNFRERGIVLSALSVNSGQNLLIPALLTESLSTPDFGAFQRATNRYNFFAGGLAILYLGQIAHTYFFGRRLEKKRKAAGAPVHFSGIRLNWQPGDNSRRGTGEIGLLFSF